MAGDENRVDIGSPDELSGPPLRRIEAGTRELAISLKDGKSARFRIRATTSAGRLARAGLMATITSAPSIIGSSTVGEPGFERDRVPAYSSVMRD
jgi:hypothetical protein